MEKNSREVILVKIGGRIEQRRTEMGLSKSEFAKLIGTSRPQLERIITGDVNSTIVRLKEICDKTGMNLGMLVTMS